jgi:hypothetical protein
MKKTIYYIKVKDGKEFYNTSRTKLCADLKNYCIDNNKKEDGWFYPSRVQLDNLIYGKVNKSNLDFIVSFLKCDFDDILSDGITITNERDNGRKYTEQYIKMKKNHIMNDRYKRLLNGEFSIDNSRFIKINVV